MLCFRSRQLFITFLTSLARRKKNIYSGKCTLPQNQNGLTFQTEDFRTGVSIKYFILFFFFPAVKKIYREELIKSCKTLQNESTLTELSVSILSLIKILANTVNSRHILPHLIRVYIVNIK